MALPATMRVQRGGCSVEMGRSGTSGTASFQHRAPTRATTAGGLVGSEAASQHQGHFGSSCGRDAAWSNRQHKHRRRVAAWAVDPSLTQEIIIGGAIVSSVAAAFFLGFEKEKEVCSSCNGSGGVVCFACQGTGIMNNVGDEVEKEMRRANLGRNASKLECRACKGVGRLLCKKCGGSGYA